MNKTERILTLTLFTAFFLAMLPLSVASSQTTTFLLLDGAPDGVSQDALLSAARSAAAAWSSVPCSDAELDVQAAPSDFAPEDFNGDTVRFVLTRAEWDALEARSSGLDEHTPECTLGGCGGTSTIYLNGVDHTWAVGGGPDGEIDPHPAPLARVAVNPA